MCLDGVMTHSYDLYPYYVNRYGFFNLQNVHTAFHRLSLLQLTYDFLE